MASEQDNEGCYCNQSRMVLVKGKHINQGNKTEHPDISSQAYGNWFSTMAQRWFNREKIVFSTNGAGTIGYPYTNKRKKGKKPQSIPHTYTKLSQLYA